MHIEIYPEGANSHQLGIELKNEFENELSDDSTIVVYEPQNLTLVESIIVAVVGQVAGHIFQKLIDRIIEAKKVSTNQDISVNVKFIDAQREFQLTKDEIFLRAYLES